MAGFDWDEANRTHIERHGVSVDEAEEASRSGTVDIDRYIVDDEHRWEDVGETAAGRILVIVSTERFGLVRVVTAFDASPATKRLYLADRYGDSYE